MEASRPSPFVHVNAADLQLRIISRDDGGSVKLLAPVLKIR